MVCITTETGFEVVDSSIALMIPNNGKKLYSRPNAIVPNSTSDGWIYRKPATMRGHMYSLRVYKAAVFNTLCRRLAPKLLGKYVCPDRLWFRAVWSLTVFVPLLLDNDTWCNWDSEEFDKWVRGDICNLIRSRIVCTESTTSRQLLLIKARRKRK